MVTKKMVMETCSIVLSFHNNSSYHLLKSLLKCQILFDRCLHSCYLKLAEENANIV